MTVNTFTEAETAIRTYIETQWNLSSYNIIPLVFENEEENTSESYMAIIIEGTFSDKTIYGSVGKRSSIEAGIVFIHSFSPINSGKSRCTAPIDEMISILELNTISSVIDFEGANPPSPVHYGTNELDRAVPSPQPEGNYYRCSASVPFIIRSVR